MAKEISITYNMSDNDGNTRCEISFDANNFPINSLVFAGVIFATAKLLLTDTECDCPMCVAIRKLCKEIIPQLEVIKGLEGGDFIGDVMGTA